MSLHASWGPSRQSQTLLPSERPRRRSLCCESAPWRGQTKEVSFVIDAEALSFFPRKMPRSQSSPGPALKVRVLAWLCQLPTGCPPDSYSLERKHVREAGSAQGSPAVPGGPTLLPKLGGHRPSDLSFLHFAVSMGRTSGVETPCNACLLSQLE